MPTGPLSLLKLRYRLAAALVLLLMFALGLGSLAQKAPTFDEQGFLVRGLASLRGHPQIRVGHPLGLNALSAAFLARDPAVVLPVDDPAWSGVSFHRPAELFMWEIGNNVEHVIFLARLPTLWLGLLLAAVAARWAGQLARRRSIALLALLFVALDPNVLAHTRLATTDLGLTAAALLAGYTAWRYARSPSYAHAIIAGAAFGLLANTKFNAFLFAPLFGLVLLLGLWQFWRAGRKASPERGRLAAIPWKAAASLLLLFPVAALLTLWATNGFNFGALPQDLPMLTSLGGLKLPLANYVEQFLDIGGRLRVGTPSFLLGRYSDSGWWTYFPVAFGLKTPLPAMILIVWGAAGALWAWRRRQANRLQALDIAALLVPALGFFAIALTTDINLGYRHILPVLPFLVVFGAAALPSGPRLPLPGRPHTAWLLAGWLVVIALWIYPNYLAYFNVLAGGPENGWRSLVDSNLDWGQDLDDLAPWMAEQGVEEVWLSYFGEARPEYYGINYRGLDSFPPRLMDPSARPFYPADPAPGLYAISATNLQGVHFTDHDQFAWFRERQPLDKLGYSIFLYDVPPRGESADLLLAGAQIDEIMAQDYAMLGGNDIVPRWFDPQQSLLLPNGERPVWLLQAAGSALNELLQSYLPAGQAVQASGNAYELSQLTRPQLSTAEPVARFSAEDGRVALLDAHAMTTDNGGLTVISRWRQENDPTEVKIFLHALDDQGDIVAQWDGLGAAWQGWREGDTLVQLHELPAMPTGATLTIGLYDEASGRRWLTADGADSFEITSPETSSFPGK